MANDSERLLAELTGCRARWEASYRSIAEIGEGIPQARIAFTRSGSEEEKSTNGEALRTALIALSTHFESNAANAERIAEVLRHVAENLDKLE